MVVRKLNAKALATDVRAGLDETTLMSKYGLSAPQLHVAIKKLLQARLVSESDMPLPWVRKNIETATADALPAVPLLNDKDHAEQLALKCPNCGTIRARNEIECSHCGIVFSKIEQPSPPAHPTHIAPGQLDPELQTGTYHDLIASTFYADVSEIQEKKRKKRLRIIWVATALAIIPFPFALLGYGKQITLIYTLGALVFVFFYYLVVIYYAWQQSRLWGLLCFWFSPVAILFVILNWNGVFSDKLLPRLWLALMGPLTVVIFLEKYCHLDLFPHG
jgi:hypothetical protein